MEDESGTLRRLATLVRVIARGMPGEREDELVLYLPVTAGRLDMEGGFLASRWHSHSLHRQSVSQAFDSRTQMLLHRWSDGDDTRTRLIPEPLPSVGQTLAVLSAVRRGVFLVVIVDVRGGSSAERDF